MKQKPKTLTQFLHDNAEDLHREYRDYAIRHDYDLDGPQPYQYWATNEYRAYLENLKFWEDRNKK